MKKAIIIMVMLFIYLIFYKTYFLFSGETAVYIVNPLVWLCLCIISYFALHRHSRQEGKYQSTVLPIIIIMTLIYVILYYGLGILSGYTSNPYSAEISGLVINFFSILFLVCIKEYLRYILININVRKYIKIYYSFIFILFLLSDINFLNVFTDQNIIGVIAEYLTIPMTLNLLMMYLAYTCNYKGPVIARVIIVMPSLIFSVVPEYNWFIITLFNSFYCLITYILLQSAIDKKDNSFSGVTPEHHLYRWAIMLFILFLVVTFGTGLLWIKPIVILTGSMIPNINPGDMPLIRKCSIEEIKVGDIIAYDLENFTVVHRVITIINDHSVITLITKGDANKTPDKESVTKEQLIGKLQFNIPYVGYPAYLLRNIVYNNKEAPSY
jgi:signal peptidase